MVFANSPGINEAVNKIFIFLWYGNFEFFDKDDDLIIFIGHSSANSAIADFQGFLNDTISWSIPKQKKYYFFLESNLRQVQIFIFLNL